MTHFHPMRTNILHCCTAHGQIYHYLTHIATIQGRVKQGMSNLEWYYYRKITTTPSPHTTTTPPPQLKAIQCIQYYVNCTLHRCMTSIDINVYRLYTAQCHSIRRSPTIVGFQYYNKESVFMCHMVV